MIKRIYKYLMPFLIFLSGFLFHNMISVALYPSLNTNDPGECAMIYNYAIIKTAALELENDIRSEVAEHYKEKLAVCEGKEE